LQATYYYKSKIFAKTPIITTIIRLTSPKNLFFAGHSSHNWLNQASLYHPFSSTSYVQAYAQFHHPLNRSFHYLHLSLAILADNNKNWRPDRFSYGENGTKMELRFAIVKILDFADKWEELEQSDNIFSLCIMAQLKAMQTKNNCEQRKKWKFYLLRLLVKKGYDRQEIVELLRFIDWLLMLPEELNQQIWHDFTQLKEVKKMPYISGFEKLLMERGLQKGIQQGIQQGLQQGLQQAKQEDILEILALKNDFVPEEIQQKVRQINDTTSLQNLLRIAVLKQSLKEFQQELNKFLQ
jgi:hypothetical protein